MDRMTATTSSRSVSATVFIRRQSLDDSVSREHTSINAKVSANHESTHRRVLLRQPIRFVGEICLVLSSVDQHQTSKPRRASVRLVQWVTPTSASTQTLQICHVEATHRVVSFVQPSEDYKIDSGTKSVEFVRVW